MKMKTLMTALMTLISVSAFAHPTDRNSMVLIPEESALVAKTDINILPKTVLTGFQDGALMEMLGGDRYRANSNSFCLLKHHSSSKDRVLRAGAKIQIMGDTSSEATYFDSDCNKHDSCVESNRTKATAYVSNGKVFYALECWTAKFSTPFHKGDQYPPAITIGEMKRILNGFFSLELSEPEEI